MILLAILQNTLVASPILINEVFYDPAGADGGQEWIELCNNSANDIDIAGWELEMAGSSWSSIWTFASSSIIPANGYAVFGPGVSSAENFSSNMQNGGSDTDGVRILDTSGVVQDTVLYDEPNGNSLIDDVGSTSGPFAPDVPGGNSLARMPNCIDSNSGEDFVSADTPTPGANNTTTIALDTGDTGLISDTGSIEFCTNTVLSGVVINEFLPDPAGSDSGHEWVELMNNTTASIDVSNWAIQAGTSSFSTKATIPEGTILAAGGYYVIGEENVSDDFSLLGLNPPDFVSGLGFNNASSNIDGIRLIDCNEVAIDTVLYGNLPQEGDADGWADDTSSTPDSFAPKPESGKTLARRVDGLDTNRSGDDFSVSEAMSPGAQNPEIICKGGDFAVKINEILPNPDGTDSGQEWVELYNAGTEAVRMDSWRIEIAISSWNPKVVLPSGTEIAPGDFFVIGEALVPPDVVDLQSESSIAMGNAGNGGLDGVRLVNCLGTVEDTLLYGSASATPLSDEEGWDGGTSQDDSGNTSFAIIPNSGKSIGRFPDGVDSNDNAVDFTTNIPPTPGESNQLGETTTINCEEALVTINEIFPNPYGGDLGQQWIELYNAGTTVIDLDDWSIQIATAAWSPQILLNGLTIPAQGFVVIADHIEAASQVDMIPENPLSMGIGEVGLDGVRLNNCTGNVHDTVLYGYVNGDFGEAEFTDDNGNQTFAQFFEEPKTLSRLPDGEDSNDNAVDFAQGNPTPGAENKQATFAENNDNDDDDDDDDDNNNNNSSNTDRKRGCATLGLNQSLFIWGVLFLGRRRRLNSHHQEPIG